MFISINNDVRHELIPQFSARDSILVKLTALSYHAILLLHELPVHGVRGRRIHGEHRVAVVLNDIVVIAGTRHSLRHLALQLTSLQRFGFSSSTSSRLEYSNGREKKL